MTGSHSVPISILVDLYLRVLRGTTKLALRGLQNRRARGRLLDSAATAGSNLTSSTSQFHLHSDGICEHDRPIKVLKLHGSLNWVVRLNSKRPPASFEISERQSYVRKGAGRKRWDLWPIVVLKAADQILFYGYSLPELDVKAEKLFAISAINR